MWILRERAFQKASAKSPRQACSGEQKSAKETEGAAGDEEENQEDMVSWKPNSLESVSRKNGVIYCVKSC